MSQASIKSFFASPKKDETTATEASTPTKEAKSEETSTPVTKESLNALKMPQLREEAKSKGIKVAGTKEELVGRLVEYFEKNPEAKLGVANPEASPSTRGKRKAATSDDAAKKSKGEEDAEGGDGDAAAGDGGDDNSETATTTTTETAAVAPSTGSAVTVEKPGILQYFTDDGWYNALAREFQQPYFKGILKFLENEKKNKVEVFPPEAEIFNAFNFTSYTNLKVVIIGQDPYHDNGQAHGLCFSVRKGIKVPPSLNTIYGELEKDIPGFKKPKHGYLEKWAHQGVLMLNATLTVQAHKANSHQGCGWQTFTDNVIKHINQHKSGVVFMLWGKPAQKKGAIVDKHKHLVLEAPHPSPLAGGGFKGCKHFSKANEYLKSKGKEPVDWTLELN